MASPARIRHGTSSGTTPAGPAPGTLVPLGNWVLGTDTSGKAYLFIEGSTTRLGGTANAENLVNYWDFGTRDLTTMAANLGRVMSLPQFKDLTPTQESALMQAVDVGAIAQGRQYFATPRSQKPGQTIRSQGQLPSGSSAVYSPIIPGSNVFSSIANAIIGPFDALASFLGMIGWIFHPIFWLRAVEFLTGLALMFYGLSHITGAMRRSSATHRTSVRSIFGDLFKKSPAGFAASSYVQRRRGRRQGRLDRSYQESRKAARNAPE